MVYHAWIWLSELKEFCGQTFLCKHFRTSTTIMIICFSRCYVFNYCRVEQNTSNETRARNKPEVIRINDFSTNFTRCRLLYVPLFRHTMCNHFFYILNKEIYKLKFCIDHRIISNVYNMEQWGKSIGVPSQCGLKLLLTRN